MPLIPLSSADSVDLEINKVDNSAVADANLEVKIIAPWFSELKEQLETISFPLTLNSREQREFFKVAISKIDTFNVPDYAQPYLKWLNQMLNGKASTGDSFQVGTILSFFKLAVPALLDTLGIEDLSDQHMFAPTEY